MDKKKWLGNRRHFLWLGLGIATTNIVQDKVINTAQQNLVLEAQDSFAVTGNLTLRQRAAAKGLIYGSEAKYSILSSNKKFADCFAQECDILVPGIELKWRTLRPSPEQFDFMRGDWLAKFAKAHNMLFRGHTLVWHVGLPKWFKNQVNSKNAEQTLLHHIKTVAGHYVGKVHSWDVVNEAIALDHGRADGLRRTPWLEFLGPNYIETAFHAAAKADPQALLAYNDYALETNPAKQVAVLKLLERLKSRGTPIHALGMQGHLAGHNYHKSDQRKLRAFLRNVADLGLKILVTEMDVRDYMLPKDIKVRDHMVAKVYEDFLSLMLEEPAVIAIMTWGLSDRDTWISRSAPRKDGAPVRPLPYDAKLNRKLAWNAIARTFDQVSKC